MILLVASTLIPLCMFIIPFCQVSVSCHLIFFISAVFHKCISLTSLTRAKCGVRSTLCSKNPNISGSIKLFAL